MRQTASMSTDAGPSEAFQPGFRSHELERRSIDVREALRADAAGIAELAALQRDAGPSPSPELVWEWAEGQDRWLVVAVSGERAVGYGRVAWFEPDDDAPQDSAPTGWYLAGIMVHPDWRGRGIARKRTRLRLDWIAERSTGAWSFTNERNAVSRRLHASLGFEEVTRDFSFPGVAFGGGVGVLGHLTFAGTRVAEQPGQQLDG